jgi:hypothetical protein
MHLYGCFIDISNMYVQAASFVRCGKHVDFAVKQAGPALDIGKTNALPELCCVKPPSVILYR